MDKARAELLENLVEVAWLHTLVSVAGLNTGTQLCASLLWLGESQH